MGKRQMDQLMKLYSGKGGAAAAVPQQAKKPQPPASSQGASSSALRAAAADDVRRDLNIAASATECNTSISDEDLRAAIAVLSKVQQHPDLFRAPRFKQLRAAVFPLVQAAPTGFVARASDAIADGRWADALIALRAMRAANERPKLGAVQRWVRDCDLAAGDDDAAAMVCLDAILRTASPEMICPIPTPGFDAEQSGVLLRDEEWQGRPLLETLPPLLSAADVEVLAKQFRVVFVEPAKVRRPPNLHDMILYTCPPNTIPMRVAAQVQVKRVPVPFAPESCFLDALFSPEEVQAIVSVAERVGFTPDVPLTGKKSILAHHFVWLADTGFINNVFDRCKALLPPVLQGSKIVGLNRRMRLYRYVPGAVYRAHVDGAWPQSGEDEKGEYVYDVSNGKVLSKLTFLIYLNEGFKGGWTTYFTPAYEEGHLRVTPVGPRIGCAMVFPHGETAGCLVHEGSGVLEGTKYIIRTEVLYEL